MERGGARAEAVKDWLTFSAVFVVFLGLQSSWWFDPSHYPLHDTLHVYECFQIAFSEYLKTGALPEWLPYSNYGMPTHLRDIIALSAPSITIIAIAGALGLENAWVAFLFLLMLEALIFALGIWLLAREMMSRPVAAIVLAAGLWTVLLEYNFQLTLRMVGLMPLVTFCLYRWGRSGSLAALLQAIFLATLGLWGLPHYEAPLFAFVYTVIAGTFWLAFRPPIRLPGPLVTLSAVAVLLFLAGTAYLYLVSRNSLAFYTVGRDPETLAVSLKTFLRYGGGGIIKSLEVFVAAPLRTMDATFFLTAPCLLLILFGFFYLRSAAALAFLALFLITLIFCFGKYSPVARIAYYFPGMHYFRHVGLVYAIPKVFGLIVAGLALEHLLTKLQEPRTRRAISRISWVCAALVIGLGVFYLKSKLWPPSLEKTPGKLGAVLTALNLIAFIVLPFLAWKERRHLLTGFLLVILIQSVSHQVYLTRIALHNPLALPDQLKVGQPYAFQEARIPALATHREATWFRQLSLRGAIYPELTSFLHIDTCSPVTRVDYVVDGVDELVRHAVGPSATVQDLPKLWADNPNHPIFRTLGCDTAKIQIVPDRTSPLPAGSGPWPSGCGQDELCLFDPADGSRRTMARHPLPAKSLSAQGIAVERFSFDRLTISLHVDQPSWLVYADAWHPEWRVAVDGRQSDLWRADFAFKAVRLEPGSHSVEFWFENWRHRALYFWLGNIGTAGLVVLIYVAARGARKRHSNTGQHAQRSSAPI